MNDKLLEVLIATQMDLNEIIAFQEEMIRILRSIRTLLLDTLGVDHNADNAKERN